MILVKMFSTGFLLLIIGAIILALLGPALASIDLTWSHAEKHGEVTATTIRNLCDNGGMLRVYQVDKSRFVQLCQIDERRYGCRIVDSLGNGRWAEVTAFIKDAFTGKTLDQIDEMVIKKFWSCTNEVIK